MAAISLGDYLDSPHFTPRERAAVLWAEHVARNTARERDDVLSEVKLHFSDAELVELTAVSGLFALSNRFQDSHCLPIEAQHEVDKIKLSVRADPRKLKAYVERLIEYWPPAPAPSPARTHSGDADGANPATRAAAHAEPAVPLLDVHSARGAARQFFSNAQRLLGGIPNTLRAWAHIPDAAKFFPPFSLAIERAGGGGTLPAELKAMLMLRTAHLNVAAYSLAHAAAYARAAGVSDARIRLLQTERSTEAQEFSMREHAALVWVEHVASNTAKHNDAIFAALKQNFDDAQVVELTGLCAESNMVNRIYNALRIPPETERQIAALNAPSVDAAQIKGYLQTVLAEWPESLA